MWRLLAFILICVAFLVFMVFNLDNTSEISFGLITFDRIPIFLTAFSSFVLGMLFAVPFVLSFGKKPKKSSKEPAESAGPFGIKKWLGSKKKKDTALIDKDAASPVSEVKKESSPYGID